MILDGKEGKFGDLEPWYCKSSDVWFLCNLFFKITLN